MSVIEKAATFLKQGEVIAYPTEGVWGLGCDPFNEKAVTKILALKQRPVEKGLILVAGSFAQVGLFTEKLLPEHLEMLRETWPGPVTWLLPDIDQLIPRWIKGQFDSAAVRVSNHPIVMELCEAFGGMIVSTSANPGEQPPAMTLEEVTAYFPEGLALTVPGELGKQSGPSEIRDLMSLSQIRSANT